MGQLMDNGCLERLAHMVIRDTQTAVQQRKVRPMRCQSILCTDPAVIDCNCTRRRYCR